MKLAACRFLVGLGIGGEIGLGFVLIAETWKDKSRVWATCAGEASFTCGSYGLASATIALVYIVGLIACFWLPETNGQVATEQISPNPFKLARRFSTTRASNHKISKY